MSRVATDASIKGRKQGFGFFRRVEDSNGFLGRTAVLNYDGGGIRAGVGHRVKGLYRLPIVNRLQEWVKKDPRLRGSCLSVVETD